MREGLFLQIPSSLEALLRDGNPWWRGERIAGLETRRRFAYTQVMHSLRNGLAPVTVLRGPRQVGKTTLLNQAVQALLDEGVAPNHIFRIQFDELPSLSREKEPILELTRWFTESHLGSSLNAALLTGEAVFLFFDEVQNLPEWAQQIKHLVDMHKGLRVLVTGSSALRIEAGRDSLAGRITTLDMGPLFLREIAEWRTGETLPSLLPNGHSSLKDRTFWEAAQRHGVEYASQRDLGFNAFSERGAYPVAHSRPDAPWDELASFLTETVILRAIQHDLRMGSRGKRRDETLLREVFRLACRYAGQAPKPATYVNDVQQALDANIGPQRILTYLKFLDGTLLMRLIEPLELRLKKKKGYAKLCLCDHALRAAWLQEVVPLAPAQLQQQPHLQDIAGRIAESAAGYFFRSITHLDVAHFPERPGEPEVDFVLTVGEQRIPIEVKYRKNIDAADRRGLLSFIEKPHYNAPFGVLVTLDDTYVSDDPRVIAMPLSSLLFLR